MTLPSVYFHISYSFHKWFLYHRGDFNPDLLNNLKEKVRSFEKLWTRHEDAVLTSIPHYTGIQWPYREIHVYCFENAQYYAVPCISDPVSINMTGKNLNLHLLYLIHELVHVIMQFDSRFSCKPLDTQEGIAYIVGNKVLEDILGRNSRPVIDLFTIPWPYDFPATAQKYKRKICLDNTTVLELLEKGIL